MSRNMNLKAEGAQVRPLDDRVGSISDHKKLLYVTVLKPLRRSSRTCQILVTVHNKGSIDGSKKGITGLLLCVVLTALTYSSPNALPQQLHLHILPAHQRYRCFGISIP